MMPDPGMLETADPLVTSLRALPVGVHVVLGIGMAAGLVLWLAGGRVARPMFALIGTVFGAALGFFFAPVLAIEPVHDIPTPYLGLGVGGLVGLAAAVSLFRFTMALTAGVVMAIAGSLGASIYLKYNDLPPDTEVAATETLVQEAAHFADGAEAHAPRLPDDPTKAELALWARENAQRTREFINQAGSATQERWQQVPDQHRLGVAGGGIGGGMFGFMLGVFVPRRAAAFVTALFGSALWLACATWTAHATGAPGLEMLRQPSHVWAVIWPATAAIGIIVQWISIANARRSGG
jgi:hypothetical protein